MEAEMMRRIAVILFVLFAVAIAVLGQDKKSYVPTEIQMLRLQLKQREAQLAQRDFQQAQARFQQSVMELNAAAEAVKRENHWPDGVTFNPDSVSFIAPPDPPKPAAPAQEKPKQ
jgi:hypothetical protein